MVVGEAVLDPQSLFCHPWQAANAACRVVAGGVGHVTLMAVKGPFQLENTACTSFFLGTYEAIPRFRRGTSFASSVIMSSRQPRLFLALTALDLPWASEVHF